MVLPLMDPTLTTGRVRRIDRGAHIEIYGYTLLFSPTIFATPPLAI